MLDQERGKSDSTQGYIRVRDTTNEADIFSLFSHAAYSQYSRIPNTSAYIAHSMLDCIIHYTTLFILYYKLIYR